MQNKSLLPEVFPLGKRRHLFLVGIMGSGKSYWGNFFAQNNNFIFFDLDDVIENEERKTINEIFKHHGEKYFRELERDCLHKFLVEENFILATGGGTPCFHNNMKWMNEHGITIWIDEPIETLVKRLLPEKAYRPLIKDLPEEELYHFLTKKSADRFPYYSQAHFHLKGNDISEKKLSEIVYRNE